MNTIKNIFFVAFGLLLPIMLFAQNGNRVHFEDESNHVYNTQPLPIDTRYVDRWNSPMSINDAPISCAILTQHNAGNFILVFNDEYKTPAVGFYDPTILAGGLTLGEVRRSTAIAVFTYISSIISINPTEKPIIYFKESELDGSGFLGEASVYYDRTQIGFLRGILGDYILTGINPFSNNPTQCTPHGVIQIDFGASPAGTIHSDFNTPLTSTEFDLYSIILHEATHSLGFASLINANGSSSLGTAYSTFDQFLFLTNRLVLQAPNGQVAANPTLLAADLTSNSVEYHGANPVFSPVSSRNPFRSGTSLSHFDEARSSNNQYVMNPDIRAGITRRVFNSAEIQVLCDLGYTISLTSNPVPPVPCAPPPVAVPDFYTVLQNTIAANNTFDVINNDRHVGAFVIDPASVELLNAAGQALVDPTHPGHIQVNLNNNTYCGRLYVRYRLGNGTLFSNFTILTINIPCERCPDNGCNFVCNGGFEVGMSNADIDTYIGPPLSTFKDDCLESSVRGWLGVATPDLMIGNPPPSTYTGAIPNPFIAQNLNTVTLNNHRCVRMIQGTIGGVSTEYIYTQLIHPLQAGASYDFTMWLYTNDGDGLSYEVYLTNGSPCDLASTNRIFTITASGGNHLNFNNTNTNWSRWQKLNFTMPTNLPPVQDMWLVITPTTPPSNPNRPYGGSLLVDDVSITEHGVSPTLPVALLQTVSNTILRRGDIVTITTTVTNNTGSLLPDIEVAQTLPNWLTTNQVFPLHFSNVLTGTTRTSSFTATVGANAPYNTSFDACATITSPANTACGGFPTSSCNTISLPTTDVAVYTRRLIPGATVPVGANTVVTYEVTVKNEGFSTANRVEVQLPTTINLTNSCLQYVVGSAAGALLGAYNPNTCKWLISDILPGEFFTLTLRLTNTVNCPNCPFTVTATTASLDLNPANNSSTYVLTALPLTPTIVADRTTICSGNTATLTASGGDTYLWSTGVTTPSITVSPTATTTATTTTYTVTITNAVNCATTRTLTVVVNPVPVVTIAGTTTIPACNGGSTTLTATLITGATYAWSGGTPGATTNTRTITVAGSYTVTVTTATGCSAVTNAIVVEPTPPTATISGNTAICTGSTTILTATGGGTYLWNTTATTPAITVAAGTYTVTVTSTNGCTASNSITVTTAVLPTITSSGGLCTNLTVQSSTLTASGGTAYRWNTNETTPIITVYQTGVYTVTATGANGCTATATAVPTVTITGTTYTRIFNTTAGTSINLSTLPLAVLPATSASGVKLIVDNTFVINPPINQPYTFTTSEILMCPSRSLNVASSSSVTFTTTTVNSVNSADRSSAKLWGSITVLPNATITINGNSLIANATSAILAQNNTKITVNDATFSDNNTGIDFVRSGSPTAPAATATLIATNLRIDNPDRPLLTKINVPQFPYSQFGIHATNFDNVAILRLGGTTSETGSLPFNTISQMNHGIFADNSVVTVRGTRFENNSNTGALVTGSSGILNISGVGALNPIFRGNRIGVSARDFAFGITVQDAQFEASATNPTEVGVLATFVNKNVTVSRCTLNVTGAGVRLIESLGNNTITDNVINLTPAQPTTTAPSTLTCGILFSSSGTPLIGATLISTNELHIKDAPYGIYCNGVASVEDITAPERVYRATVSDNTIFLESNINATQTQSANVAGLYSTNSSVNYSCNHIFGAGKNIKNSLFPNDTYSPSAIQASTDNSTFSCNETYHTYTGILLQGVCNNAVLQGSMIGTHHFGLNFTQNLGLQTQTDKSNTWTTLSSYTGTDKAARHEATSAVGLAGIFKTSSAAPYKPDNGLISVTGSVIIGNWFALSPNAPPSICTNAGNVCGPSPFAMTTNSGDATQQQLIAGDIPTTETYEVEQLWESQKQLFEQLKEGDPAAYSNDPILSAFVNDKADETVGQFYEVKEQASNAFTPSATLKLQLSAREVDIKTLTGQITVLDDTYTSGNLSQNDWNVQRAALLQLLDAATTQYKTLLIQYETVKNTGIDAAKSLNDAIVTAEVYEANAKAVNDIYLRTIAKNNVEAVTATDKTVINYIASQCPYTGGTAVYVARALQVAIRKDTFYNDTENCFTQGVNYRIVKPKEEVKTVKEELSVKVYPNPASDFFTLSLSKTQETITTIELIDVLGRVVQQSQLAIGSTKLIIPIVSLTSGVYHCKVSNENGVLHTSKLVITK